MRLSSLKSPPPWLLASICLVALGFSIRMWLVSNHFPHYDDLWGEYRALHIKSMPQEEFLSRLPQSFRPILESIFTIPAAEWFARHLISVFEATYHSTIAPLHYVFAFIFVGMASTYPHALAESRVFTLLEYILFLVLMLIFSACRSHVERRVLCAFSILSLFGGLPLFYSVQGHNYMMGLCGAVVYLIVLSKSPSSSLSHTSIRASSYSLLLLASYNFIIFLPAFYICEAQIYASHYRSSSTLLNFGRWRFKTTFAHFLALIIPLVLSLFLKIIYIVPGASGAGWNSGLANEYIVDYSSFHDFFYHLYFSMSSTMAALFLPTSTNSLLNFLLVIPIVTFILLALRSISGQPLQSDLPSAFATFALVSFFLLYLFRYLAISPTRHSLVLFPFIALLTARGVNELYSHLSTRFYYTESHEFLPASNPFVILLAIAYICLISWYLPDQIRQRQDPLSSSIITTIGRADTIYYDEYFNFSLSVAPELRHLTEAMVTWPLRDNFVIKKSNFTGQNRDENIIYATNSFSMPPLVEVESNIAYSSGCISINPLKPLFSRTSSQVVDSPPRTLTLMGTNSLHLYSTTCHHR